MDELQRRVYSRYKNACKKAGAVWRAKPLGHRRFRRKVFHSHGGILRKVVSVCQVVACLNGNKLLRQKIGY
jgi:hypothetical protein